MEEMTRSRDAAKGSQISYRGFPLLSNYAAGAGRDSISSLSCLDEVPDDNSRHRHVSREIIPNLDLFQ